MRSMTRRQVARLVPFLFTILAVAPTAPLYGQAFHSSHAANLPTTTTLPAGDLLFEISHRFSPPVSQGADALWGLDGPVVNRLGLAYALTDRAMLGVTRSNLDDNVELGGKARVLDRAGGLPVALGLAGAVAWNTAPALVEGAEDNETQAYLQAIVDVALGEVGGIGLVPTYLRNPRIRDAEADDALVLGVHGRVAVSESANLVGEWVFSEEREGQEFDTGSFGLELRTRGHFFKLFLTNQIRMNPSQMLGGSAAEFEPDAWRLGFNITRRIAF